MTRLTKTSFSLGGRSTLKADKLRQVDAFDYTLSFSRAIFLNSFTGLTNRCIFFFFVHFFSPGCTLLKCSWKVFLDSTSLTHTGYHHCPLKSATIGFDCILDENRKLKLRKCLRFIGEQYDFFSFHSLNTFQLHKVNLQMCIVAMK